MQKMYTSFGDFEYYSSVLETNQNMGLFSVIDGTKKSLLEKEIVNGRGGSAFRASEGLKLIRRRKVDERHIDTLQHMIGIQKTLPIFPIIEPIKPSLSCNSSLLLLEMERNYEITFDAKQTLHKDFNLLSSVYRTAQNILSIENEKFRIKKIDITHDPEIPEWKPIVINLEIKLDNFGERLKLKHKIIKKAFEQIDEESRKNIFIIGAI